MTVRELMQKILLEAPDYLDSRIYFDVPREDNDILIDSYEIVEISGTNESLYFIFKKI